MPPAAILASDAVFIGGVTGEVMRNSPFVLSRVMGILTAFGQVDWFDTGIVIPDAGYYRTTVTGTMITSGNPEYEACMGEPWPYPGATYGPLGLPGQSDLKVTLWYDYTSWAIGLSGPEGGTTATNVSQLPAGTHLKAMRSGIAGSGSNGTTGCSAPGWALSGAQQITVEKLPPPTVHATKNPVAAGEAVTFVASGPTELYSGFWWWFMPFDTLATPAWPTNDHIWPCEGKTTCTINVSVSGRMYLNRGAAYSEIVWVKNPSVRLTLSCSPAEVPAGGTTTCTASTSPAGEALQVQEWFFVPDSATQDQKIQSLDCATENPCTTHITANGTVYVRATVARIDQTAGAPVTRARPTLEVTASATLVHPGDSVTFTAQAPGASSIQVDSPWVWVAGELTARAPSLATAGARPVSHRPDLGSTAAAAATTAGCGAGVNPCTVVVTDAGRMHVWAVVDGDLQDARSPTVQIVADTSPAPGDSTNGGNVTLSCDQNVQRGGVALCEVAPASAAVTGWHFTADAGLLGSPPPKATSETTWSGPMVASGTVEVTVGRAIGDTTLTAHINVEPRPWTSPAPTTIDSIYVRCSGPTRTVDCPLLDPPTAYDDMGRTFTSPWESQIALEDSAKAVTDGPNEGYSYLASTSPPYTFAGFRMYLHGAWKDPSSPLYQYHTGLDGLCTPITALEQIRGHEWVHVTGFQSNWPGFQANELLEEQVVLGPADDLRLILGDLRERISNDIADAFDTQHTRYIYPSGCTIDFLSPYM